MFWFWPNAAFWYVLLAMSVMGSFTVLDLSLTYFVSPKFAMGSAHEPCQRSQTPRATEGAEGTPRKEEMMGWWVPCKTTYV